MEINQSMIKAMFHKGFRKEYCPKFVHAKYVTKEKCDEASLAQLRGIYFENRTLGGELFELPTKKNGDQTIDTIRINEQIRNFPGIVLEKLMFFHKDINTQVKLKRKWNDDYTLQGTLDWFPTFFLLEGDLKVAIVDLKLTGNIHSTWGDFCWGEESALDWIQGAFYSWLVQDIDYELNSHLTGSQARLIQKFSNILNNGECIFVFLVFDYKHPPEHKFIQVEWNYDKLKYLENSVEKTIHEIEMNELQGWEPYPSTENCKTCLLNCSVRNVIAKI